MKNSTHPVFTIASICLAFVLAVLVPAAAFAAPTLTLGGDLNAGRLEIGGDLEAGVTGAPAFTSYTITLLDETNTGVVRLRGKTNAFGELPSDLLWPRTGVEGCDVGAVHDPLNYRFQMFGEAESVLGGRTFTVSLFDDAAKTTVAVLALPLEVVTPFLEGYASDGAGCPRLEYQSGEPMHLTMEHQAAVGVDVEIFLVDHQDVWTPGDALIDVRGAPQLIHVPAGMKWVGLVWLAPVQGDYQVIARPPGSTGPYAAGNMVIEMGSSHGTPANDCGSVCPP
ncbi:MAG: hypothetical protein AAGM22_11610 [Acidobacteriota bacterium]